MDQVQFPVDNSVSNTVGCTQNEQNIAMTILFPVLYMGYLGQVKFRVHINNFKHT